MPSLFKKSKKPVAPSLGGEDNSTQTRPLMYASSTTTSSFKADNAARADSSAPKDSLHIPGVRDGTKPLISSDMFADIELYKRQKAARAAAEAERAANAPPLEGDAEGATSAAAAAAVVMVERPSTPAQGSRRIPWESYHDLAPDHPVFLYPAEVREKMYAKGVDPVLKAMGDRNIRGKVYGQHRGLRGFMQQGKFVAGQLAGTTMGGATTSF